MPNFCWTSLVHTYQIGGLIIEPIETSLCVVALLGANVNLDFYINHAQRNNWKTLIDHDVRIFKLRGKYYEIVLWLSWLGRRGTCWHIIEQFSLLENKGQNNIQDACLDLVERYQIEWSKRESNQPNCIL
jgi:hypothetical protein